MTIDKELSLLKMLEWIGIQSPLWSVVTLKIMGLMGQSTVIQFIHPGNFVAEQF